jgi:hypothetical protein
MGAFNWKRMSVRSTVILSLRILVLVLGSEKECATEGKDGYKTHVNHQFQVPPLHTVRSSRHPLFDYCVGLIYDDYRETARKEKVFCSCCNHFAVLIDGNHQPPNLTKTPQMQGIKYARRKAMVLVFQPASKDKHPWLVCISTYPHTLQCKTGKLEKSHIHAR